MTFPATDMTVLYPNPTVIASGLGRISFSVKPGSSNACFTTELKSFLPFAPAGMCGMSSQPTALTVWIRSLYDLVKDRSSNSYELNDIMNKLAGFDNTVCGHHNRSRELGKLKFLKLPCSSVVSCKMLVLLQAWISVCGKLKMYAQLCDDCSSMDVQTNSP